MKKAFNLSLVVLVLIASFTYFGQQSSSQLLNFNYAFAQSGPQPAPIGDDGRERETRAKVSQVTNSRGLFIQEGANEIVCDEMQDFAVLEAEMEDSSSGFSFGKIISNFIGNLVTGLFSLLAEQLNGIDTCGREVVVSDGQSNIDYTIGKGLEDLEGAVIDPETGRYTLKEVSDKNQQKLINEAISFTEENGLLHPLTTLLPYYTRPFTDTGNSECVQSVEIEPGITEPMRVGCEGKLIDMFSTGFALDVRLLDSIPAMDFTDESILENSYKHIRDFIALEGVFSKEYKTDLSFGDSFLENDMGYLYYQRFCLPFDGTDDYRVTDFNPNDVKSTCDSISSEDKEKARELDKGLKTYRQINHARIFANTFEIHHDDTEVAQRLNLGILSQINIFTFLVNISNVPLLMGITGYAQELALVLSIFFLLYKAYKLMRGNDPSINEATIVNYVIRFTLVVAAIYYAPALMQDILSLNNILVHTIAQEKVTLNLAFGSSINQMTVPVSFALLAIFGVFVSIGYTMLTSWGGILAIAGAGLVFRFLSLATILLVMLISVLIPIVKLAIWWYTRLFKIFVYTVIMPIMLLTLLLD